ncbi:MAG: CHAT domain-containing protein [Mucilaginibacter sp.]
MIYGKTFVCFIAATCLLIPNGHSQTLTDYKHLYNYAEKLSNDEHHNDSTDARALRSYLRVVNILETTKKDDPFLFKAYISSAAFLQVLGQQKKSIGYLKNAIALKATLPELKDSVLFRPLVYCGNAYYTLDVPDTAESFYKKAASIAEKYPNVNEQERLYNTLGVISYSKGNYTESITYYEKAIATLTRHKSYDNSLLVVYKNNLASALKKLKKYDQALEIYESLLPYKIETNKLLHNIGSAYLAMGNNERAIFYLQKVGYEDQRKLNDLGLAYLKEKNYTQATYYLQKSVGLNTQSNKSRKNSDYGISLKYLGDICFARNQIPRALAFYQQSINNLLIDFNSNDIHSNPTNFSSAFNGIELLETLSAKAVAFKALYVQTNNVGDLETSLQTYLSFYQLANHIERFYETDESRLLISDKKYFSREQPINVCLQLFRITANKKFIEIAFSLDEENKASILSLYLEESKIKTKAAVPPQLLQNELHLKEDITRASLKASGEKDSLKLIAFKGQINELTIKLLKVQQKISQKTGFGLADLPDERIVIEELQKIIPAGDAILSYHIGDSQLLCFIITDKEFTFFTEELSNSFLLSVNSIYKTAQSREGNNTRQIRELGQALYKKLIKPAESYIKNKNGLMIIPDNELNFLPFELLVDDEGENLLNKFTITYNYSCNILQNSRENFSTAGMTKLGMAPFDEKIMTGNGSANNWIQLPASRQELQLLNGTSLLNRKATKEEFLKVAHNFNIIHLATHAYANDLHPEQSYILFYPTDPDSLINYKLYMPEIYNLSLDKTRLIVLSACESGVGELAKGEGLMSLSRAFSYSGCDNIITSMWKADDESTAYISGRLYFYLQKGFTVAEALRKSKLDYLEDPQISSSKKLAGFWAHLRLTGDFERHPNNHSWIFYASILLLICIASLVIKKGRLNNLRRP